MGASEPGERSRLRRVPFVGLIYDTLEEWIDDDASRHAATLAFYALLSLAPLVVLLVATVGLVFGDDAARGDVARQLHDVLGREASRGIEELIERSRTKEQGVVAAIVSPLVLLYGASHVVGELQVALDAIWGVRQRPGRGLRGVVVDQLVSFAMVIGVALLLLAAVVLRNVVPVFATLAGPDSPGWIPILRGVDAFVSFTSVTLVFAVVFKAVPHVRIAWREVWIGAIATAVLFTIGRAILGLYFEHTSIASPHGAAGSLFVLVLWVYYSAQILFLGAEFTQVYARRNGSMLAPTRGAVRIADAGSSTRSD